MMHVVGGVYDERCMQPQCVQLFGSAGRAAAALGALGEVTLVTAVSDERRAELEGIARSFQGVRLVSSQSQVTVSFDYVHPLSVPTIAPPPHLIPKEADLHVDAEQVLRFGMMESDAVVRAKRAIYDPQSAFVPRSFSANGSSADELAIVANAYEVRLMTGERDVEAGANQLLSREGASVVVVKRGSRGALVLTAGGTRSEVPAYRTDLVFSIGSGDIFAAAFAHFWAREGADPAMAADLASKSAAWYCSSRSVPLLAQRDLQAIPFQPVAATPGCAYLAAPFFSIGQRWLVEEARSHLMSMGVEVFSPLHEVGMGPADVVAPADLAGLDRCDRVLALVDGGDCGTVFEVGYARARGLPVVAFAETLPDEQLKMIVGSGCQHTDDFATAIYLTAWAS